MTDRELLTIREAATRVKVSRRTIYSWMTQARIEYVRTAGGKRRIYADSLIRSARQDAPR